MGCAGTLRMCRDKSALIPPRTLAMLQTMIREREQRRKAAREAAADKPGQQKTSKGGRVRAESRGKAA